MAGDGIVKVGATFDKTGVDVGLGDTQEMVKASMAAITATIAEAGAKSKAAWKGLTDEVKTAAQSISAESLKVAEATKAQTAAYADLRRASVLVKDSSQDELATTAILAAAQQKAAEAAANLAAAKQVEAEAVAAANEKAGLSENFLVATFQRAEMAIGESLAGMRERLVLTGETAHITARDMTSAFSGLGELLGIGLLAGFAGNYLDELAKMNVELDHLSTESGISVSSLAGLQQIVKEMGADWDPMEKALVLFEQNIYKVSQKEAEYVRAVQAIGLSWDELKDHTPEQQLGIVAAAFANTADQERVAYAAKELFGRGGAQLIPILKEQGAALEDNMKKTGALTGITGESAAAARQWTKDVADLTMEFRSFMMPVMDHAGAAISYVAGTFEIAAAAIVDAFEGVATVLVSTAMAIGGIGTVVNDVMNRRFDNIPKDAAAAKDRMVQVWKDGFADIAKGWNETVVKNMSHPWTTAALPEPKAFPSGGADIAVKRLKEDERELNELKLTHRLTVQEEQDFWRKKLAVAQKGSDEYYGIEAKLAELGQRHGASISVKKSVEADEAELTHLYAIHRMTLDEEAAFWQKKIDTNKGGYDRYIALLKKRSAAEVARGGPTIESTDLPAYDSSAAIKFNDDQVKAEIAGARAAAEEKMRIAAEDRQDTERDSAFAVEMGRITAQQRIEILRRAAVQEEQIRQQQLRFISMLDMNDAQRYQADLLRQAQATRQFARLITQLNQQTALESQKVWTQAWGKMTADLNTAMSQWVAYGQGFEQSMAKSMGGITANFTQNVMKMMEQEILAAIQHKALMKEQIMAAAKVAAADSYKWASGWGGPIAGAVAAGVAFAGVMAFDSFADGGVVRGGGGMAVPILAHAGERVLTQSQTENFHKMVDQSTSSSNASNTMHLHLQQNVNAYDRSGMRSTLRAHAEDLLDIVQGGINSGRLKPA